MRKMQTYMGDFDLPLIHWSEETRSTVQRNFMACRIHHAFPCTVDLKGVSLGSIRTLLPNSSLRKNFGGVEVGTDGDQ